MRKIDSQRHVNRLKKITTGRLRVLTCDGNKANNEHLFNSKTELFDMLNRSFLFLLEIIH